MRTIRELIQELRETGADKIGERWTAPALIQLPVRAQDGDDVDPLDRPLEGPLMRGTIEATGALAPRALVVTDDAMVHFIVKRPEGAFRDRIGIGRTRNSDIMLPYPRISKYHAFFRQDGEEWTLSDAGSRNGTYTDRARLEEGEARVLEDGEEIRIGPYPFLFFRPKAFIAFLGRRIKG